MRWTGWAAAFDAAAFRRAATAFFDAVASFWGSGAAARGADMTFWGSGAAIWGSGAAIWGSGIKPLREKAADMARNSDSGGANSCVGGANSCVGGTNSCVGGANSWDGGTNIHVGGGKGYAVSAEVGRLLRHGVRAGLGLRLGLSLCQVGWPSGGGWGTSRPTFSGHVFSRPTLTRYGMGWDDSNEFWDQGVLEKAVALRAETLREALRRTTACCAEKPRLCLGGARGLHRRGRENLR